MGELERIANHLGDVGAICNDASFAFALARFGWHREMVLRACAAAFGHRLMMDCVVPGGVAVDIDTGGQRGGSAARWTMWRRSCRNWPGSTSNTRAWRTG